jgi:class 3 adenylate cyclase
VGVETATIVVCDLVASTELRVSVGEEQADAVRRDVDAALGDSATAHGGTVVKGLGDGVLALFAGAADAVAAGVAMQQAATRLAQQVGSPLGLRVGISAGDVSLEDGDCFGTPVVESSRLCAVAAPGEVLVADVVRVLARGRGGHGFQPYGPIELKGLPEPVESWSVPWEPIAGGTGLRQAAPYVGRRGELATLADLVALAHDGQGATVLVAGEPGMGKTRLVAKACRTDQTIEVLWGGCHDGDVVPGSAFAEAITTWAREVDPEVLRTALGPEGPVLATLAPALRAVVPELPDAPVVPGDEAAARLQDALCQWLGRLAAANPVALVIDDLHWADDTTVRLLRTVARAAARQRVVVIGTYRETDLDRSHPFAQALPLLRREVEPTRLALSGLIADEVEALLEQMAGHDVSPAFAELLAEQCGGNPFFIRETLLHLVEEGRLAQHDGEWRATTADLGIPEGVREVLGRRLGRLSPVANRLLRIGALFEVSFPLPVVCDVADVDEDEALDAIDEALEAQIVEPTAEFDAYRFTHALFRHALVAELNPSRQVRTHRALAEAIEERIGRDVTPAEAATLARHYSRSSAMPGAARGVPHALRAADNAEAGAAFREAYGFSAMARELLEPHDDRESEIQRRLARNAVLAQIPIEDQVAEAATLGELVATVEGADAAADAVCELVVTAHALDETTTTWRIAAIARRWLRPERRDHTWITLRGHELDEIEANDPASLGLSLDTAERRELFNAFWGTPTTLQTSQILGAPGRRELRRWLALPQRPGATAVLLFHAASEPRRLVALAADRSAAARQSGRLGAAALFAAFQTRALLVLGEHEEADRALADAAALLPRISQRSNGTLQVLACYTLAGWVRGAPLDVAQAGIGMDRTEDPNTKWAGIAVLSGSAYTTAWLSGDHAPIHEIEAVLPAVERAPGSAPNYPLIVHLAVGVHWWLERRDHLGALRRNLEDKILEPDQRYLETDGRWIAARIASLEGRHDDARAMFDAARAELAAEEMRGLLVGLEYDAALAESRAGIAGDRDRFDAAIAAARSGIDHHTMHPWLSRLDALTPPGRSPASR